MNRRSFLTAVFGSVATSAVGAVVASETVKAAELPANVASDLDTAAAEFTQYYGRNHRPRPRRQVCTVRRNRFGRPERICRWVY